MSTYSSLELNDFLTRLMTEWDEQAAAAVVEAFHQLPSMRNSTRIVGNRTARNPPVTGHTNEVGDVTIPDEEVGQTRGGEREEEIARVGYYKVRRKAFGRSRPSVITWQHFSATAINSSGKTPLPVYGVEYIKEGLKPMALMRWDFVEETEGFFLGWKHLVGCFRSLIRGIVLYGKIPEAHTKLWYARPTILFGRSQCGYEFCVVRTISFLR